MKDLNNNDPLEELFKSKSEQYDISYREEDWQNLKDRLDAADVRLANRNKRWLTAAAVLILFSLLGYFTYQNYQQINSLNEQLSQTEETINEPAQLPDQEQESTTNATDSQYEQQSNQKPNKGGSNAGNTAMDLSDDDNTSSDPEVTQFADNSADISRKSIDHLAISELNCNNCQWVTQDSIPPTAKFTSLKPARFERSNPLVAAGMTQEPEYHSFDHPVAAFKRNRPNTSLGLVLGPDLSTVGSVSNFYNPGLKIGVTADFYIGRDFALSVGAIRSDVRYKANGLEYKFASQGYGNAKVLTNQTIGKCILIDIPIQLSYQFLQFNNSRFYASAGFSSYIMLNEDYQFEFNSNQQGYPDSWQGDTGTTHFFSNASVSVGYEFDLGQNLSLRAEPFIKIPIQKVGRADVDLYSVGSLLSINYHLY